MIDTSKMRDWVKVVATVAPNIATALGTPLAGAAVSVLGKFLIGDEKVTEDTVKEAVLNASPETLAKIQAAEMEFNLKLKELDVSLEKIAAADRSDARTMHIALEKDGIDWLGMIILAAFIACLMSLFLQPIPNGNSELIYTMIGALLVLVKQFADFRWGSSLGSKLKTMQMGDVLKRGKTDA